MEFLHGILGPMPRVKGIVWMIYRGPVHGSCSWTSSHQEASSQEAIEVAARHSEELRELSSWVEEDAALFCWWRMLIGGKSPGCEAKSGANAAVLEMSFQVRKQKEICGAGVFLKVR